jgi:dolichol-phosphate mannosyltransferase
MSASDKISIAIPAYNENRNLVPLCQEIKKYLPEVKILIVDDSLGKESVNNIAGLNNPDIQLIHRGKKKGRGSAVLEAFRELFKSDFTYFIEMDADFSHSPSEISRMIEAAQKNNYDLVIASRYLHLSRIENWPLSRRIFSSLANQLLRTILQVPVSDYTAGFRLYSRNGVKNLIENCGTRGTGFIVLSESLVCLHFKNFKIGEISSVFKNRINGESSLSLKEILNSLTGLWKIYQYKQSLINENTVR